MDKNAIIEAAFNSLESNRKKHSRNIAKEIKEYIKYDKTLTEEEKGNLLFIGKYHDIGYSLLIEINPDLPHELRGARFLENQGFSVSIINIVRCHGFPVDFEESKLTARENYLLSILNYFDVHVDYDGRAVSLPTRYLNSKKRNKYFNIKEATKNEQWMVDNMKNIMGKPFLFLDVDNTLLINGQLSKENQIAIYEINRYVILNTGKIYHSLYPIIKSCDLSDNYHISLNGSVTKRKNGFLTFGKLGVKSKNIIDQLSKKKIHFLVYYVDGVSHPNYLLREEIDRMINLGDYVNPKIDDYDFENSIKILVFAKEEEDQLYSELNKLAKSEKCVLVRSSPYFLEFSSSKTDKGKAIKKICRKKKIYYRNSIAIGDSMNDLPMLEMSGLPYIMPNSSKELIATKHNIIDEEPEICVSSVIKNFYEESV